MNVCAPARVTRNDVTTRYIDITRGFRRGTPGSGAAACTMTLMHARAHNVFQLVRGNGDGSDSGSCRASFFHAEPCCGPAGAHRTGRWHGRCGRPEPRGPLPASRQCPRVAIVHVIIAVRWLRRREVGQPRLQSSSGRLRPRCTYIAWYAHVCMRGKHNVNRSVSVCPTVCVTFVVL